MLNVALLGRPFSTQDHNDPIVRDVTISWAVYIQRDDEDWDILASFPADSQRTVECRAKAEDDNDNPEESLAYHAAHELAASVEYEAEGCVMLVPFNGCASCDMPSVYDGEAVP